MKINENESTTFPIEVKVISTQSEQIIDQPSVPKSKSDFKTKEEKQQYLANLAEDTRHRLKRSAMDIYCIGLNLLEAQNITEHGEFLPWLRQEFGMGKTSAYEFINVAKAFESKFPIIGNLINNITPTALYKLAAPSTCQAARDEAIDIVKAGQVVDPDVARNLIKKYKTPKAVKSQQQKTSSVNQESEPNQVEVLFLDKVEVGQSEQTSSNSISSSSTPQQNELQKLVAERDTYKAQVEDLQIINEQLQLEIKKLHSELALLQISMTMNGLH
ncbi:MULTISPECIES: DUF3102 domain-containing protein [Nostoc]|uniref:DUF3102 domain-containing protein n=1 Tax=Nostoc paludosum FACHB-159 TaxID=2692908 RepID=A0ABR8KN32_9NOSO|nr:MULTISPECIES: DUF3102 domain-containing protein [Nostoc]MBD2739272.1 DUF3102 domain-containing protein [Nostoc paludosum FACHB-159]